MSQEGEAVLVARVRNGQALQRCKEKRLVMVRNRESMVFLRIWMMYLLVECERIKSKDLEIVREVCQIHEILEMRRIQRRELGRKRCTSSTNSENLSLSPTLMLIVKVLFKFKI